MLFRMRSPVNRTAEGQVHRSRYAQHSHPPDANCGPARRDRAGRCRSADLRCPPPLVEDPRSGPGQHRLVTDRGVDRHRRWRRKQAAIGHRDRRAAAVHQQHRAGIGVGQSARCRCRQRPWPRCIRIPFRHPFVSPGHQRDAVGRPATARDHRRQHSFRTEQALNPGEGPTCALVSSSPSEPHSPYCTNPDPIASTGSSRRKVMAPGPIDVGSIIFTGSCGSLGHRADGSGPAGRTRRPAVNQPSSCQRSRSAVACGSERPGAAPGPGQVLSPFGPRADRQSGTGQAGVGQLGVESFGQCPGQEGRRVHPVQRRVADLLDAQFGGQITAGNPTLTQTRCQSVHLDGVGAESGGDPLGRQCRERASRW